MSRPWETFFRALRRVHGLVRDRRAESHTRRNCRKLNKEINGALADPNMKARLIDLGDRGAIAGVAR